MCGGFCWNADGFRVSLRRSNLLFASAQRHCSQVNEITAQAMEHTAVRNAVAILGGEVKGIRPLTNG